MRPSIGRIVRYTLTCEDARNIARRREYIIPGGHTDEPARYAFEGNAVGEHMIFPALITGISGDEASLQVFLDGNDCHWVTDAREGDGPGCWAWPVKDSGDPGQLGTARLRLAR